MIAINNIVIISAVIVIFAFIIITLIFKSEKTFRCLFLSIFSGVGSLFAVNIASYITGVSLAINGYTLFFTSVFSIPGTIVLLLSKLILI